MNQPTRIPREWQTLLTARQYQCVLLEHLGWSQHQIARHLGISRSTVQTHLDNAARTIARHEREETDQCPASAAASPSTTRNTATPAPSDPR